MNGLQSCKPEIKFCKCIYKENSIIVMKIALLLRGKLSSQSTRP